MVILSFFTNASSITEIPIIVLKILSIAIVALLLIGFFMILTQLFLFLKNKNYAAKQIQENQKIKNAENEAMNIDKKALDSIAKAQISLKSEPIVPEEEFKLLIEEFDKHFSTFAQYLLPAFVFNGTSITRCYSAYERIDTLERLSYFWDLGFRNHTTIPLLLFYQERQKKENFKKNIFKYLTYFNIENSDKIIIQFLFQDIINEKFHMKDLHLSDILPEYQTEAFMTSLALSEDENLWDRTLLLKKSNNISGVKKLFKDRGSFVQFFQDRLWKKGTPTLKAYLMLKFAPLLHKEKLKHFINLTLKSGKYARFGRAPSLHYLKLALEAPDLPEAIGSTFDRVVAFLTEYDDSKLHLFYFYLRVDASHPEINNLKVKYKTNKDLSDDEREGMSQFELWLHFIHQSYTQNWATALNTFKHLNIRKKHFYTRFYAARALFNIGEKIKGWNIMFNLWQDDPANLLLLNEASIYAFYAGKREEAENIFDQMKRLYPNHPATLHNEAVFYEKAAMAEIEERWQRYRSSTSSSVS